MSKVIQHITSQTNLIAMNATIGGACGGAGRVCCCGRKYAIAESSGEQAKQSQRVVNKFAWQWA